MEHGSRSLAVTLVCLTAMTLAGGAAPTKSDDEFEPNYASRMLTPIEGSKVPPSLVGSRQRFPMRVVVMNGFYFNERYYAAVKQACAAWVDATKSVKGGGVTLTCEDSDDSVGADVVIVLCSREQAGDFSGFTDEFGAHALIRLSVFTEDNKPVSPKALKRVAMHEFGHALGIWGHSPDSRDIMSVDPETSSVSIADVNTLKLAYSGKYPPPWRRPTP
jgi:hypothetical protein